MIFINQVTGSLFADIVQTLKEKENKNFLITGCSVKEWDDVELILCQSLNKVGILKRLLSWSLFFFQTFWHCCFNSKNQNCIFVTNPPINIWIAPFIKWLFGNKYSIIIYDIYPEVLIETNFLRENSIIVYLWKKLNQISFKNAEKLITLNAEMVEKINNQTKTYFKIYVIENWVDTKFIKPKKKINNPFIIENNLKNKFIVLYAGSFGATHDVEKIISCF